MAKRVEATFFSFSETERLENKYELNFEYEIDNRRKRIDIYLTGKTDKGKCPYFPTPNKTDNLCISNGDFFIPENKLIEADYLFAIRTADFTAKSILSITKDKVTLKIPENEYFSSAIKEIFPAPKNLLYGHVIFEGSEKTKFALEYFGKLKILGLRDTTVANPPFNLFVDANGKPKDEHWEPDNHSLAFLYSMNISFQSVVKFTTEYFHQHNLNMYLFSTNGDQARFSKVDGIITDYAK